MPQIDLPASSLGSLTAGETGHLFRFTGIGTQWEIETETPLPISLQREVLNGVKAFDAVFSRFRADSLVARMVAANGGGRFDFPEDSARLFAFYDRLHDVTGGAVDPLVGADLERLGYDRTYRLKPAIAPAGCLAEAIVRRTWSQLVRRDGSSLTTEQPLVIDLGAAGKGYLVDRLTALLAAAGQTNFLIDGSGDMRHVGATSLSVGLEHPFEPETVIGVVELRNDALCASAVNRRAWGQDLHHVLDGRTGKPTNDVVATWVLSGDALTADGLATALFFVNAEELLPHFNFSSVCMLRDGRVEHSSNFSGQIFW